MKTKPNIRLLRKIQTHIAAEPRRFFMRWFIERGSPNTKYYDAGRHHKFAACGTVACIAGWAILLSKGGEKAVKEYSYSSTARDLLGLTHEEADCLFADTLWPLDFCARFRDAVTPRKRVQVAVERIEHFIKHHE